MNACSRTVLWLCVAVACAALLARSGPANAANDPPQRQAARISFNSGISAHEFPADASKVTVEHKADGTRIFHLNGQGMEAATAHRGADGKLEFTCSDKADGAHHRHAGGGHHER